MDQIDCVLVQRPFRWRLGLILLLGSLGLLALLPTGCSPPCPGKCMKFKIKLSPQEQAAIDKNLSHTIKINLTTKDGELGELTASGWTIKAPDSIDDPTKFFKQEDPVNPKSETRSYTLLIPGLPDNLQLQLTGKEPVAKKEMTGYFLALSLNLGTIWLSKLSEPNGVTIWLNADGFSINGASIYASAFIHRGESKCNAFEGSEKLKIVDLSSKEELVFSTWVSGGCPPAK